jgi:hypothetical protein
LAETPERHQPLSINDVERIFKVGNTASRALRKRAIHVYKIKPRGNVTFGQILNANQLNDELPNSLRKEILELIETTPNSCELGKKIMSKFNQ